MYDTTDVQRTAREWNAYTLHLWPDPRLPTSPMENERRLLAVCFDLSTGRLAFLGAVRRFPGREITLRDGCRIVCSSHYQHAIDRICADLGVTDVPKAAPEVQS